MSWFFDEKIDEGYERFGSNDLIGSPPRLQLFKPEDYLPGAGLVDAVNVALVLGQPLLLTGEPGTGKTQLAYTLGWKLGLGEPLKFETKSTSCARDLFYTLDSLGRFRAAQSGIEADPLNFISYNALGVAILRANDSSNVAGFLPPDFVHGGKRRSVVLIDEVDKASRDFPNDILNEIEHLYFKIPELGNIKASASFDMRPIIVITSNSEKNLPDAFLRRCVYYNIPFPERQELERIVSCRLGELVGDSNSFIKDALEIFYQLRDKSNGLRKRPSTAEFLGWLITLSELSNDSQNPIAEQPDLVLRTLSALVKAAEDQERSIKIVERWLTSPK